MITTDGRRLILNDGTTIENGEAGFAEGFLWLRLPGYTMQQAASIFFDSSKTERIVFEYGEMTDTYDGFTVCVNINVNIDGMASVCLVRGTNNANA